MEPSEIEPLTLYAPWVQHWSHFIRPQYFVDQTSQGWGQSPNKDKRSNVSFYQRYTPTKPSL